MSDQVATALRLVVAGGLAAAAMTFGCATPASADWLGYERALTTGSATQDWPQLSGTTLVYADHGNERTVSAGGTTETLFDVRVLDLTTGKDENLTPGHTALGRPVISGDLVVWSDYGSGPDQGIWSAGLATGRQRRLDASPGSGVQVSGERICYGYLGRIHIFELRNGRDRTISPAGSVAGSCDISGDVVVWQDHRNGHDSDIYSYNVATGREDLLAGGPTEETSPRIDQSLVIWQDQVADNIDIYARDLATGSDTRITDDPSVQWFADVADGRIVWMDERNGHNNSEIYLYDVASGVETRVTGHDGWSGDPTVAGDRIVYEDAQGAGHNLYLRRITAPRLALSDAVDLDPLRPVIRGSLVGADGVPVSNETVVMETSIDGSSWQPGPTAVTLLNGGFSIATAAPPGDTRVRVRFGGTPEYPAVASTELVLRARPDPFRLRGQVAR